MLRPYLYIEHESASNPVLQVTARNIVFIWDPKLSRHVKRFATIEEFEREAHDIVFEEGYRKIFTGIEVVEAAAPLNLSPIERIAFVCHETNRAFCATLGDLSQQPWFLAEAWQRESAIKGVHFRLDHPDAPASATHDAWSADKFADGWTYGTIKDPVQKTHPCLVPFAALPLEQQSKDLLFGSIVHILQALIPAAAEEVPAPAEQPLAINTEVTEEERQRDEALKTLQAENARILVLFGDLTPELLAQYAAIILEKTGLVVSTAEASPVAIIRDEREFGMVRGVGFRFVLDGQFIRQAVILPSNPDKDEAVIASLADYFRAPDKRLVIGEENLGGRELSLWKNEDGSLRIATLAEDPRFQGAPAAQSETPPPDASTAEAPPAKKKQKAAKKPAAKKK